MRGRIQSQGSGAIRILVIGPTPPPLGGATLRLWQLLQGMENDADVELRHIETHVPERRLAGVQLAWTAFRVLVQSIRWVPWAEVVTVHLNRRGRFIFGPLIWVLSGVFGKPMILRVFGGEIADQLDALPAWWRWVADRTICRSELILVQTAASQRALQERCSGEVRLLPNFVFGDPGDEVRTLRDPGAVRRCSRFVYMGRVCRLKGIEELLKAVAAGSFEFTVDLWGPLEDGYSASALENGGLGKVRWNGVCKPDRVLETLRQYDCLLLPSRHPGEGHPAVILEAYCAGLPVIATRWQGIPEVVDETTGILIEPGDWEALHRSMKHLYDNPNLWLRMAAAARARHGEYDYDKHVQVFLDSCRWAIDRHGMRKR